MLKIVRREYDNCSVNKKIALKMLENSFFSILFFTLASILFQTLRGAKGLRRWLDWSVTMSGAQLCQLLRELGYEDGSLDPDSLEWPFQYEEARPILNWLCSTLRPSNVVSPSQLHQLLFHIPPFSFSVFICFPIQTLLILYYKLYKYWCLFVCWLIFYLLNINCIVYVMIMWFFCFFMFSECEWFTSSSCEYSIIL